MFFTKMAIRFLASAAFVLSYMGSSYGQCPSFTLKLEQPNPDLAIYDVILETPPWGIQDVVTLNVALNFGIGATNLGFSNVHPQLNSTNMSVNENNFLLSDKPKIE